jgi:hypothetical protein
MYGARRFFRRALNWNRLVNVVNGQLVMQDIMTDTERSCAGILEQSVGTIIGTE